MLVEKFCGAAPPIVAALKLQKFLKVFGIYSTACDIRERSVNILRVAN